MEGGGGEKKERGRSKSPSRKSSKKRSSKSPDKGKKKGGGEVTDKKVIGKAPEEWTKQELMDKVVLFATFEVDRVSGSGRFEVSNRRILDDEIIVILEVLRRYTEIQHFTVRKCFLTDAIFAKFLLPLKNLRHLKTLNLAFNGLTSDSVREIVGTFSMNKRRLQHIDLRENLLDDKDGISVFKNFLDIDTLNGISMKDLRAHNVVQKDTHDALKTSSTLVLHNQGIKLADVAIICCIIQEYIHINELDLSKNHIDCYGAKLLVTYLYRCPYVRKINLSKNPITNHGKDFSCIEAIQRLCRERPSIIEMKLDDIYMVPKDLHMKIDRSTSVNRAIKLVRDEPKDFFQHFIFDTFRAKAPPPPEDPLAGWEAKQEIDKEFFVANKLDTMSVAACLDEKKADIRDDETGEMKIVVVSSAPGYRLARVGDGQESFGRKF